MRPITSLECSRCNTQISAEMQQTVCPNCAGALYARYDLSIVQGARRPAPGGRQDIWRYAAALPWVEPVTLGEGWTRLLASRRRENLFLKEDAANPTGSSKARGISMAVSVARHYGITKLAIASTGNAAAAVAAYAAAAGLEAHLFLPRDVPPACHLEAVAYGARITLVDGTFVDCTRLVAEGKDREGWFDLSAMQEPFRLEGQKTVAYELVEQLGWEYPDAVIYPTGSGLGLISMWKAFGELEALGWVKAGKRPKMIAVEASDNGPSAGAGAEAANFQANTQTLAAGLRVPKPFGDSPVLDIVGRSEGTVIDVDHAQIMDSLRDWAQNEGLLLSPEGAATTAAYDSLLASGFLSATDRVVVVNPVSGLKYAHALSAILGLERQKKAYPVRSAVGGIITPV